MFCIGGKGRVGGDCIGECGLMNSPCSSGAFSIYDECDLLWLFAAQGFDWVGKGHFYGLEADGEQGYQEGAEAGESEDPPGEGGVIRVVL